MKRIRSIAAALLVVAALGFFGIPSYAGTLALRESGSTLILPLFRIWAAQ